MNPDDTITATSQNKVGRLGGFSRPTKGLHRSADAAGEPADRSTAREVRGG